MEGQHRGSSSETEAPRLSAIPDVRRDIIVVGASVGGLKALIGIVADLPEDFGAAIVAVIHTSASSPMLLAKLIGARHGSP